MKSYSFRVENALDGFYEESTNGREVSIVGSNRKTYRLASNSAIGINDFESITLENDPIVNGDRYYVTFFFTKTGADKFSEFTMNNLNKKIFLVLGGEIVASPMGMLDLHDEYKAFIKVEDFKRLFIEIEDNK